MSPDPLLTELAAVLNRIDPIPTKVLATAEAAPRISSVLRELDTDLLRLQADSALGVPAGLRCPSGGTSHRFLRFSAETASIDLEISTIASRRLRLIGLVAPIDAVLELLQPHRREPVRTDRHGRFYLDAIPRSPLCFLLRTPTSRWLNTNWFIG